MDKPGGLPNQRSGIRTTCGPILHRPVCSDVPRGVQCTWCIRPRLRATFVPTLASAAAVAAVAAAATAAAAAAAAVATAAAAATAASAAAAASATAVHRLVSEPAVCAQNETGSLKTETAVYAQKETEERQ